MVAAVVRTTDPVTGRSISHWIRVEGSYREGDRVLMSIGDPWSGRSWPVPADEMNRNIDPVGGDRRLRTGAISVGWTR